MEERGLDRLGAIAALLTWLAVAVPVLADAALIDGPRGWWWGTYLAYGAMFIVANFTPDERPGLERLVLGVQAILGLAVFALAPRFGFTAVLLVITAATAAYVLPLRAAILLVAAQTLGSAIAVATALSAAPAVTTALVFGGFQVFAVLMVEVGQREARARAELARVHGELEAAHALLAESTRATERLRIARDLHDLVGHQLTGLILNLEAASHHAQEPARGHVERSRAAARALLQDVREVVGQLREPPSDLVAELRSVTEGVPRPAVHLRVDPGLAVTEPGQATALVRCVQEVVTNAVRHASADNLWIEVAPGADGTRVRAWDDGRGAATLRQGNGLAGMRERFEQLGGHVAFVTGRGEGFSVEGVLPR